MATQMQLKVLFGSKLHGRPDFHREKTTSRVFFDLIFYVYTHVDNRERAEASDSKQRRRISLEQKAENFIAAVRKSEMPAASKMKMRGSEKIKANMNTGNKIFGTYIRQCLHKNNV